MHNPRHYEFLYRSKYQLSIFVKELTIFVFIKNVSMLNFHKEMSSSMTQYAAIDKIPIYSAVTSVFDPFGITNIDFN